MNSASIIFDSRERKRLYKKIQLNAPLILHDEYGFEIIKLGSTIFKKENIPN